MILCCFQLCSDERNRERIRDKPELHPDTSLVTSCFASHSVNIYVTLLEPQLHACQLSLAMGHLSHRACGLTVIRAVSGVPALVRSRVGRTMRESSSISPPTPHSILFCFINIAMLIRFDDSHGTLLNVSMLGKQSI